MNAKRTKVILSHFNEDFVDLPHVWVDKTSILSLQEIWKASKSVMEKYVVVEISIDASTYIDFPAKNKDEGEMAGTIKIELEFDGHCRLTISNGVSEAYGEFQL